MLPPDDLTRAKSLGRRTVAQTWLVGLGLGALGLLTIAALG